MCEEIVEFILVCGLRFLGLGLGKGVLWGERGLVLRLLLFGKGVECGGEGLAGLLLVKGGAELGEGVV